MPFLLVALASEGLPEGITYRIETVMWSSTGPRLRARAITPASMLLLATCAAVIRGVRPVGRSSSMIGLSRRNSFRIRCSTASSSQSSDCTPSS
ncbi:hypothetical protein [Streptomyces noursei]|uniref:hypothetical protein n=1 Tax=Streptomyces noursei TaxID=1971 RepID=UPI001F04B19D|nr:hypothetical protein [Streptomyces noursei]